MKPGLCVRLQWSGVHRTGWDFGGTGVMLAGEVSSLLFPALEAAEMGVCDSLGTLFS